MPGVHDVDSVIGFHVLGVFMVVGLRFFQVAKREKDVTQYAPY